jgi:hypothetical protein
VDRASWWPVVGALLVACGADRVAVGVPQVTALFNYYNRIADGLGIEAERERAGGEASSVASTRS